MSEQFQSIGREAMVEDDERVKFRRFNQERVSGGKQSENGACCLAIPCIILEMTEVCSNFESMSLKET